MSHDCCCPHGSWPRLQVDYQSQGTKLQIANTTSYHVGKGDKVLVMVSDIFGATSGKHQAFADTWAEFGYNVYLPELLTEPYNGEMDMGKIVASIKNQNFETMKARFAGVAKYLEQQGHKSFFVIGFCWGVWLAFKMAAEFQNITAIGGMHPSLGIEQMFGGDVIKLTEQIKSPAFLFPAGNDPADIKPEGAVTKLLQQRFGAEKAGSYEFPDMIHGFTVRGDINDEQVKRDVEKSIHLCKDYFAKFV